MKNNSHTIFFLILILISFVFIRQFRYLQLLTCGQDTGVHFMQAYNFYITKDISLIGPPSDLKVEGREFYFGPAINYLPLPFLLSFGWNQRSVSYLIIILELVALLSVFWILSSKYKKRLAGFLFLIIYSFSPLTVHPARLYWNPTFIFPLSTILIAFLLSLKNFRNYEKAIMFSIGIIIGVGFQFHYSFMFAALIALIWIINTKRFTIRNFLLICLGFALGFSPIIIFEIRNQFYNTLTILKLYQTRELLDYSKTRLFYYYPVIPFLFITIALFLARISTKHRFFVIATVTLFTVIWYISTLPKAQTGISMPQGWNCQGYEKMKDIIIREDKYPYNLLDQLTGESRALYLRGILTVSGNPPLSITDYPSSRYLYVFTKNPANDVLKSDQWEIQVLKPARLLKGWHIQSGINLYLLEKIN